MTAGLARLLPRLWWRPRLAAALLPLLPLSWLAAQVAARRRAQARAVRPRSAVPVIVVGNVVVGGAGKTPTVIALVRALESWGFHPGIVSRGHGRTSGAPELLDAPARPDPGRHGDEPVLMHLRTGAPVSLAADRPLALEKLLQAHPDTDVVVADDGLQHHALAREIEVVVFDDRGQGNGHVLPAGPLRERMDDLWPHAPDSPGATSIEDAGVLRLALINGAWPPPPARPWPSRAPCPFHAERHLAGAVELAGWVEGQPPRPQALDALRGRRVIAAAGIGQPERFFSMLEAAGLLVDRLPLPDHAAFDRWPWPPGSTDVLITEKDAVKAAGLAPGTTRVWVVALDFRLPEALLDAVRRGLARRTPPRPETSG